jgi:hypothetical protein
MSVLVKKEERERERGGEIDGEGRAGAGSAR